MARTIESFSTHSLTCCGKRFVTAFGVRRLIEERQTRLPVIGQRQASTHTILLEASGDFKAPIRIGFMTSFARIVRTRSHALQN